MKLHFLNFICKHKIIHLIYHFFNLFYTMYEIEFVLITKQAAEILVCVDTERIRA